MKVRPGSIVPINFEFWPEKSNHLVMAMVLSCEDQWFNLCPIHCEPELAGFNDLVIMPKDSSLNMFMVVMGKLAAGFPAAAISPEVFAKTQSPRIQSLNMSEAECDQLRKNTYSAMAATSPDTSYMVNRGNFITPGSKTARKIVKFTNDWISFNKASWNHEFSSRHISREIDLNGIIDELSLPLEALTKEMTPPKTTKPAKRTGVIGSSSAMRSSSEIEPSSGTKRGECAGKIGRLFPGLNLEPETFTLETLRKKLSELITGTRLDTPTARKLLQGPISDLVKLLLKLFPR